MNIRFDNKSDAAWYVVPTIVIDTFYKPWCIIFVWLTVSVVITFGDDQ